MLDTPIPPVYPPAPAHPLTPPVTPYDGSARTSVSDGEGPDGWRIVQRHQWHGPTTTTTPNNNEQTSASTPGIVRSRTLPSSWKGRPGTDDGGGTPCCLLLLRSTVWAAAWAPLCSVQSAGRAQSPVDRALSRRALFVLGGGPGVGSPKSLSPRWMRALQVAPRCSLPRELPHPASPLNS